MSSSGLNQSDSTDIHSYQKIHYGTTLLNNMDVDQSVGIEYKDFVVTYEGKRTGLRVKAENEKDARRKVLIASGDLNFDADGVTIEETG